MTDDLDAPLGLGRKKKAKQFALPRYVPHIVAGMLGAALLGFAGWALVVDDPLGGEPFVTAALDRRSADTATPGPKASGEHAGRKPASPTAAATGPAMPAGAKTVTIIDGMSGKRQEIAIGSAGAAAGNREGVPSKVIVRPAGKIPTVISGGVQQAPPAAAGASPMSPQAADAKPAPAAKVASADPRLLEQSRHGGIPKVGPGGERPAEVYASRLAPTAQGKALVAIVIGRLGVSAKGTTDALAKLPPAISVAFAPYGADLDKLVARARSEGREVLLQVPMEPFDYPDNDPGPQTLLTSLTADQNIDRLHWFMSRFQAYVGIGNYMGARFAGNEPAVSVLMREVAKRGLIYFDDGTATRSLVGQVAGVNNVPFARADILIDATPTPSAIDAALARLEALARERGSAVGAAISLPVSIDHIAKWAEAAAARGVTLVPISVIANRPKSS